MLLSTSNDTVHSPHSSHGVQLHPTAQDKRSAEMEGPDPGEWDVVFEPSKTYLYPQASSLSIKDANDDLFDARCAGPSAYAQPGSRSQGTRSKYEVDDDVSMAAASTEQQGMAATSGAMKGKGKVAEGRKVKGKGKAKPPVQLPDEVWTCIWDWYYKDIAAGESGRDKLARPWLSLRRLAAFASPAARPAPSSHLGGCVSTCSSCAVSGALALLRHHRSVHSMRPAAIRVVKPT